MWCPYFKQIVVLQNVKSADKYNTVYTLICDIVHMFQLTPVERYAVSFVEHEIKPVTTEELEKAEVSHCVTFSMEEYSACII